MKSIVVVSVVRIRTPLFNAPPKALGASEKPEWLNVDPRYIKTWPPGRGGVCRAIGYLHVICVVVIAIPLKANPILVIDSDAVLALPVSYQLFQAIAGNCRQVT